MLASMTRIRPIAVVLLLVVFFLVVILVANALYVGRFPKRADPPPSGAPAEIGVAYGAGAWCMLPIELGGLWWAFPEGAIQPPVEMPPFPLSIWANVSDPSPTPGVLILSSANQAVFRADSDGSEFTMTASRTNPKDVGCL